MALGDLTLNPGVGGDKLPRYSDGTRDWIPGLVAYLVSTGSPDVLQTVTPTVGLPVQQQTGATWTVTGAGGTFPVTGTFWQATQPVSGPLTDAQLRATAVPVSGTFWQATQPVSGPLTDTQLRASAFAVTLASTTITGTVAATQSGTWNVGTVTTLTGITNALPAGTNNIGDVDVLTVPADPFGANADAASATGSISAKLRFIAATGIPVTGTVTVGTHAVTQSGTWNVGTLTTITNVVHVDDNAGSLTVDGTVAATQSGTWTVQPGNTANTTAWLVSDAPQTTGGLSSSSFLSTAAVQSTAVKASPGMVYSVEFFNVGAAAVYVRLYNQTGAPAAGDNANIVWRGIVPGNTAGAGFVKTWDKGLAFSAGIGMRCTAAIGDTDNTALAANGVVGNIGWK